MICGLQPMLISADADSLYSVARNGSSSAALFAQAGSVLVSAVGSDLSDWSDFLLLGFDSSLEPQATRSATRSATANGMVFIMCGQFGWWFSGVVWVGARFASSLGVRASSRATQEPSAMRRRGPRPE